MKTANLVGISADHSAQYIVDYNLQDEKTEGSWRGMKPVHQQDLISFRGNSNLPSLSIQQKGTALKSQMASAMRAHVKNYSWLRTKNPVECNTVVQSYELLPNMSLTPKKVHQMGNEFYSQIKTYLKDQYNYQLDTGLVSTHIDRDQDVMNQKHVANPIRHAHLHNHIVLPEYNNSGKALWPYLRKNDIYNFQHLNDGIASDHNLHDYYFGKLMRQIYPFSAYTMNEYGKARTNGASHIEKAWVAFKKANDYAWDKNLRNVKGVASPQVFKKAREDRDLFLKKTMGYSTKKVKDKYTHKTRTKFTMGVLTQDSNHNQQWYNLNNMRILRWRDRKEMRAERLLWQFDFSGLINKPVSFNGYKKTVKYATKQLPNIGKIVKPKLRKKFMVNLSNAYQHVEKALKVAKKHARNAKIKMSNKYRQLSKYGARFMTNLRNFSDHIDHHRYKKHSVNFLVNGVNRTVVNVQSERARHRKIVQKRNRDINRKYAYVQDHGLNRKSADHKRDKRQRQQGPTLE